MSTHLTLPRGGNTCGAEGLGSNEINDVDCQTCIGIHDATTAEDALEQPHVGHFSRIGGTWWCDTCNSPYCDLA